MALRHKAADVLDAVREVAERLAEAGCETPRVDAELLVAHVLGTTRAGLYADSRHALSDEEDARLDALVGRRERREPLAYVLGEWGFRRLTLTVDARVLVPRPETEVVVERCLAALAGAREPRVLDVGTGSGAIALALADEHPGAQVTGMDISGAALALARENAARTGLEVTFVHADLLAGLPAGRWDVVVSNPPYVRAAEIGHLAPEVREWEPRVALVGRGETEAIAASALDVLRPGGTLVLEVADGKAAEIAARFVARGYEDVRVTEDLAGRERVVEGVRP